MRTLPVLFCLATAMKSIPLFLSQTHACSYLDNQEAQSLFIHPSTPLTPNIYQSLLAQGFRRSGDEVYTPHCPRCTACVPTRLRVKEFIPNKTQQRCLKKNSETTAILKPAVFEQAHYEMYLRYQDTRHHEGSMAQATPEDYLDFLSSSWCDTYFIEFSIHNELAGIAVIDQVDTAWSAVYTFFEPKFSKYSLGVYAVLWQINQLKHRNKEFLYLGFWIEACKKMTYKSEYQPLQGLIENRWVEITNK